MRRTFVMCIGFTLLGCTVAPTMTHMVAPEGCSRPAAGSSVEQPEDLRSRNGVLSVDLTARNEKQKDGTVRYCYLLDDGNQSPTLRVKPGDLLILRLKNQLSDVDTDTSTGNRSMSHHALHSENDSCNSGAMKLTSTNLHFHGLTIPPVCHQDDTLKTSIPPSATPFEYRFRIPEDEPPGLYWYHPHIHGFTARQVLGGASGALIVEGIERAVPAAGGLPERLLIIRDQDLINPDAPQAVTEPAVKTRIDHDGDAANNGTGAGKPAKDLSINFIPVPYPDYPPAVINVRPLQRELWRVLNSSSITYLNLSVLFRSGSKFRPQRLEVIAVDGVPIAGPDKSDRPFHWGYNIVVPPGSRLEFILYTPRQGVPGKLVTRTVDTGQGGENDPNRTLASIVTTEDAVAPTSTLPASAAILPERSHSLLDGVTPNRVRKLYFSEDAQDPQNPNGSANFYLTVDGQRPAAFDPMSTEPNIVVRQGDVEDWIIENRSTELHTFHIHQLHFQVIEQSSVAVHEPFMRDTVNVPFFSPGMKQYPSVRIRMDFRDPNAVGSFVYHCHLLDHEDAGMMGLIRVNPSDPNDAT